MSTDTSSLVPVVPAAPTAPVVFPALDLPGEADGFARGHAAGYAAGLRRAADELCAQRAQLLADRAAAQASEEARTDHAVGLLAAAARSLHERTAPVLAEVEPLLVATALSLAEVVLGAELSDAPHAARAALARGLSAPDAADVVHVRLHPDDAAVVAEHARRAGVVVVPDAALSRGDAVAVYPDGELDARIGAALERARAVVGDVVPGAAS